MTETLFSECLKVQFKNCDNVERRVTIKVTVEVQTTTSPLHRKDLLVRITDDNDPFFLYNLCLSEEDFQMLKVQQGLLVDFGTFPQKFIGLLQLCQQEEAKEEPKFLLQFCLADEGNSGFVPTEQTGLLKVIETNPFKHLSHLCLNVAAGNDTDVKKYLASRLKSTIERREWLENKLKTTENELSKKLDYTRQQLSDRTKELDRLQTESKGTAGRLTSQHMHELNLEREKALKIQEEMQSRYEKDRKELQTQVQKNVGQKDTRISELENLNKDLTDRRYRAEATIREQKTKLAVLDDEHRRCHSDLQQMRRENSALEAERHSQDKSMQQLKLRVAVLEQEVLDKEQLLSRITSSLDAAQEQKVQLDDRRVEQQTKIQKLESTIKTMSQELMKGNEIIKKLQDELRGYMGKVKFKNEVTTRQECAINEKDVLLEKTKKELDVMKINLKNKDDELEKTKQQLKMSVSKLEENHGILKTNENVINWLNKQINELQINSRKAPAQMSGMTTEPLYHQHMQPSLPSIDRVPSPNLPLPTSQNYSTPIGPYVPSLPSSQKIGVSSIGNSLGSKSMTNNTSPVTYNKARNKENLSPGNAAKADSIDPKYFTKTVDEVRFHGGAASGRPASPQPIQPLQPALNRQIGYLQNPKSNDKALTQRPAMKQSQQAAAVSAYFTGTLPKST